LNVGKLEAENSALKSKLKIAQSKAVGGLASWRRSHVQLPSPLVYPKQTMSRHFLQLSQHLVELTNFDRQKQSVLAQRLALTYQPESAQTTDNVRHKVADSVLRSVIQALTLLQHDGRAIAMRREAQ
jgi:hypothetical protein